MNREKPTSIPLVEVPNKPSALKAIRKYCIQCGDGTMKEVEHCQLSKCPLHPYRFGMMPHTYLAKKSKKTQS